MKEHSKSFLDLVKDALHTIPEIDVHKVKNKLDTGEDFYLVDVREESERQQGEISGSIYLGKGIIPLEPLEVRTSFRRPACLTKGSKCFRIMLS